MELLRQVLAELLSEAQTALAVLRLVADAGILSCSVCRTACTFYYHVWKKEYGTWVRRERIFACFYLAPGSVVEENDALTGWRCKLAENPVVTAYKFGDDIANPGGLLAKILAREKEKLASIVKLQDVLRDELND